MSEQNPNRSNLDEQQIFQRSFNEDTDRIRVDAEISASIIAPPGLEVSINSVDDNIAIRNSDNSNELLINSDGSINVTSVGGSSNINLIEIDGNAASVNNGVADTGTLRVAVASNNTPFSVNSIQSGSWTTGRTWNLLNTTDSVNIGNFPANQSVTQGTSPWVVSGTVTANIGTTNGLALNSSLSTINTTLGSPFQAGGAISNTSFIATQATGTNLHTVLDSGVLTSITNTVHIDDNGGSLTVDNNGTFAVQAAQSGIWTTGRTWNLSSVTDSIASVQSGTWNITNISGTISLPTGASTSALQTTTNTSIQALQVTQGSTTSGQSGTLTLGAVTTSAPSYSTGQTDPISLDTSGLLRISLKDTPSNTNKFLVTADPITFASPQHTIVDSGSISVTQGTSPWVVSNSTSNDTNYGTVGANTLRTAAQIGNATGAALFGAGTTTAQVLRVVLPTDQTSIPAAQSGSWSVTANAGTNLNTSLLALESGGNLASIKTNTDNLNLSQASTTSGQKGNLILGATTTAAPSYTTAQSNPISLTTAGAVRVDGSGVTQPVSISGNQAVNVAQINGVTPLMGNGVTGTGSQRVTIASDNTAFSVNATLSAETTKVIGTVNQGTSPWIISGSVTANAGTNLNTSALALDTSVNGILVAQNSTTSGQSGPLVQTATTTNAPTYTTAKTNPLSTDTTGLLRVSLKDTPANTNKFLVTADAITFASPQHVIADTGSTTVVTGNVTVVQPTGTNLHVVVDSAPSTAVTNAGTFAVQATLAAETTKVIGTVNQGTSPWVVSGSVTSTASRPSTGTTTSVASSASSVTLLTSNANRLGGSIYNDSTQILYIKFGSAASNSSYKLQMSPQSFFEIPSPVYTGIITGIWASANGNARISEET